MLEKMPATMASAGTTGKIKKRLVTGSTTAKLTKGEERRALRTPTRPTSGRFQPAFRASLRSS